LKRKFKEVKKMVSGWEHDMKCQEDNELKCNEDKLLEWSKGNDLGFYQLSRKMN
jgi:hypothetical protein